MGGVPVFVMLPLDTVNAVGVFQYASTPWFTEALTFLANSGAKGVALDCWWGAVERKPKQYDFTAYKQVCRLLQRFNLRLQVVMSFHACGTNVNDDKSVPLPEWVLEAGKQDPDIFFTDRPRNGGMGSRNRECLSLFCDNVRCLQGRSPMECYRDMMAAFASSMGSMMGTVIEEVVVGAGPCGELRYPSYVEANGWRFPGVGEFQCYDRRAMASLARCAQSAGHPEWGYTGPTGVGNYNALPMDTSFFNSNGGWQTPAGKFFLTWYSSQLIEHASRLLTTATTVFYPYLNSDAQSCIRKRGRVPLDALERHHPHTNPRDPPSLPASRSASLATGLCCLATHQSSNPCLPSQRSMPTGLSSLGDTNASPNSQSTASILLPLASYSPSNLPARSSSPGLPPTPSGLGRLVLPRVSAPSGLSIAPQRSSSPGVPTVLPHVPTPPFRLSPRDPFEHQQQTQTRDADNSSIGSPMRTSPIDIAGRTPRGATLLGSDFPPPRANPPPTVTLSNSTPFNVEMGQGGSSPRMPTGLTFTDHQDISQLLVGGVQKSGLYSTMSARYSSRGFDMPVLKESEPFHGRLATQGAASPVAGPSWEYPQLSFVSPRLAAAANTDSTPFTGPVNPGVDTPNGGQLPARRNSGHFGLSADSVPAPSKLQHFASQSSCSSLTSMFPGRDEGVGILLSLKIAGIHWWYHTPSHAAELTAGYYNSEGGSGYHDIVNVCADHACGVILTCVEMSDNQHPPEALCGPEPLLKQVRELAYMAGLRIGGENALACITSGGVNSYALEHIVRNSHASHPNNARPSDGTGTATNRYHETRSSPQLYLPPGAMYTPQPPLSFTPSFPGSLPTPVPPFLQQGQQTHHMQHMQHMQQPPPPDEGRNASYPGMRKASSWLFLQGRCSLDQPDAMLRQQSTRASNQGAGGNPHDFNMQPTSPQDIRKTQSETFFLVDGMSADAGDGASLTLATTRSSDRAMTPDYLPPLHEFTFLRLGPEMLSPGHSGEWMNFMRRMHRGNECTSSVHRSSTMTCL